MKLKHNFGKEESDEIWEHFNQYLNPSTEISQMGIIMISFFLPVGRNTDEATILKWLKPLMGLWETRPNSGLMAVTMFSLLA